MGNGVLNIFLTEIYSKVQPISSHCIVSHGLNMHVESRVNAIISKPSPPPQPSYTPFISNAIRPSPWMWALPVRPEIVA